MATHPPASAFKTVWVNYREQPDLPPLGAWALVLRDRAAQLIADGIASDPYTVGWLPVVQPASAAPAPAPITVAITAISAADPAVATLSAADVNKIIAEGATSMTISGATGTDAALVNGVQAIAVAGPTTVTLIDLDNSAPLSFAGYPLTCTLPA